ncbi:MAG TPA: isocitrate lyase/phosphoenolpyruvate mutase family protein [Stellaceae bacterium]
MWQERRRAFRRILDGSACVHPASVFDPLSARMAEKLGFEISMLAGSLASYVVLGDPDIGLMSLPELAAQAGRIGRAGGLPLLVDADHGFGNALNVARTIVELENVGVAAVSIEDTALPLPYGQRGAAFISINEMVGKLRAAVAARHDPEMVVVGRTTWRAGDTIADLVGRAAAYAATGIDALFVVGLRETAALEAVAAAANLPLILGGASPAMGDAVQLARHGVRISLQGHQPFLAALRATFETMRALRSGVRPGDLPGGGEALLAELTHAGSFEKAIAAYLRDE